MSFVKYRYLIFGILGAAYILVFFHRLAPALVAVDMMRDLKTGGALMGILASAYFYPYALMQIPAGLLSDSLGTAPVGCIIFHLRGCRVGCFGICTKCGRGHCRQDHCRPGCSHGFCSDTQDRDQLVRTGEICPHERNANVAGWSGSLHGRNASSPAQ